MRRNRVILSMFLWTAIAAAQLSIAGNPVPKGGTTKVLLYSEDFEGSQITMGTVSFGHTQEWFVDNPSNYSTPGLPGEAAQGSYCAGTVFADVYDDVAEDLLYTPEIDFGNKTAGELSFAAYFDLESAAGIDWDGVRILGTPDMGRNWYLLTPTGGYPSDLIYVFDTPGFGGASGRWQTYSVELAPLLKYARKWVFAWEFRSDSVGAGAGFFLDDVKVTAWRRTGRPIWPLPNVPGR